MRDKDLIKIINTINKYHKNKNNLIEIMKKNI